MQEGLQLCCAPWCQNPGRASCRQDPGGGRSWPKPLRGSGAPPGAPLLSWHPPALAAGIPPLRGTGQPHVTLIEGEALGPAPNGLGPHVHRCCCMENIAMGWLGTNM
jgi:hypothetical protein